MTCHVSLSESRLLVRTAYHWRELCKTIPGARWDRTLRVWSYPASPYTAKEIMQAFPDGTTEWTDGAAALLVEADRQAKAQAQKAADNLPPIPKIKTQPWTHQLRAFWYAHDMPAVMLALDMGTGKSKVTVDLIVNRGWQRVLILAPKSVVQVWPMEIEKHAAEPLPCLALDAGSMIQRTRKLYDWVKLQRVRGERAVVVTNYDGAWRGPMDHALLTGEWDAVILDESHRIKSPGGRAAMFCSRLGDTVPHRLCLTGTPLPHSPLDAYGQYRFLDKGIFGTSFTNFRARYAIMGGYGHKQVVGYQNQEDFNRKFYSLAYRVRSDDVLSLPDAVDVVRPVNLGDYARKVYDQLAKDFTVEVADGRVTASNALTRLLRLQQVASGWAKQDASIETGDDGALLPIDTAKQDTLADLLEDVHANEPVVVFCRFWHDLDAVRTVADALGRGCLELSGRTNQLAQWQSGEAPILAVQIQSGGIGINLTRARYCVFYSLGFSLGEYLQARKRVHRPGQDHSVTYFHLVAQKTVDVQVYKALEARQDVVESILMEAKG